jgi:hypothetical protein
MLITKTFLILTRRNIFRRIEIRRVDSQNYLTAKDAEDMQRNARVFHFAALCDSLRSLRLK